MRPLFVAAAFLAALLAASPAGARSTYCSPTGDFCSSVARTKQVRFLRLSTFSFMGMVKICVRDPTNLRVCHAFRLVKSGPLYQVKVRWKGHYPNRGPGRYRVSYWLGSTSLGPTLTFTLRR